MIINGNYYKSNIPTVLLLKKEHTFLKPKDLFKFAPLNFLFSKLC